MTEKEFLERRIVAATMLVDVMFWCVLALTPLAIIHRSPGIWAQGVCLLVELMAMIVAKYWLREYVALDANSPKGN